MRINCMSLMMMSYRLMVGALGTVQSLSRYWAIDKADDLTIQKLTRRNPSIAQKFAEIKNGE